MVSDLKKVKDKVKYILEKYPATRDSDKLMWLAFCKIFHGLDKNLENYKSFKAWFMDADLPSMESVRRCRQKIQENNEELRGKARAKKLVEAEPVSEWALKKG